MNRKNWIIGLIGFSVFAIVMYMTTNKERIEPEVYVADNWEDVKAFQYEKIPGLRRAEKLGLARQYENIKVEVPGTNRTLSIDEIWFAKDFAYLFYSIDLAEDAYDLTRENAEENFPELFIKHDLLDDKRDIILRSSRGRWPKSEGIVYQNRLYQQIHLVEFSKNTDQGYERISSIDELLLTDAVVRIGDETYELEDIRLPVYYDEDDEVVKTIHVGQELEVMGHTLKWEKLELGTSKNKLYFLFYPAEDRLGSHIELMIKTDRGEVWDYIFLIKKEQDELYSIQFPPFNYWPSHIDIELKSFGMIGSDEFSFEVDTELYKDYLKSSEKGIVESEENEYIGTIKNTDIYLNYVYRPDDMAIVVSYEQPKNLEKPYTMLFSSGPIPANKVRDQQPNLIVFHIENEKGENAVYGSTYSSKDKYGIFLKKDFLERSEKLLGHVSHLHYQIVTDWQGAIEVPAE
ncbi:MAG: hypothetical protein H0Z32_03200 [Bacillaceae bacterium]|nr:hypothetical protein [Bacillaceae bacterium]